MLSRVPTTRGSDRTHGIQLLPDLLERVVSPHASITKAQRIDRARRQTLLIELLEIRLYHLECDPLCTEPFEGLAASDTVDAFLSRLPCAFDLNAEVMEADKHRAVRHAYPDLGVGIVVFGTKGSPCGAKDQEQYEHQHHTTAGSRR